MENWLHEAKKQGLTLTLRHAKIMFCGPSKAGKTSFSHLLRNIPLRKGYNSTPLGEAQQILVSQKVDVIGTEWKYLDVELEMQKIMSLLVSRLSLSTLRSRDLCQPSTEVQPVEAEIQMTSFSPDKFKSDSEIWDMLTLLDTGGQPEFANLLPAISASTALTFLVVDLSGGVSCLDQHVKAQHSDQRYKFHTKNYTNLQLLKCLMSSVKESATVLPYCPTTVKIREDQCLDPAVCFVGTHSDVLGESLDHVVEIVDKQISESVKCINADETLSVWNYNGRKLVVVDNTTAGKNQTTDSIENQTTDSIEEKIRSRISEEILEKKAQYEIPIVWCILELQLRCEKKVFIPIKDVKVLADHIMPLEHKMEEWQLVEALKFYHSIGVLLYFDEDESGMSDIVITDPQWLFSNLTKLVNCTFIRDNFVDDRSLNNFANNGIFNAKLLRDINLDMEGIRKESFLQLLKYLKIVAPIDEKGQEYFMPCVLPHFDSDPDSYQQNIYGQQVFYRCDGKSCVKIEPLLIKFTFDTIPRGFFCFLVVQLLQNNARWKLYGTNDYDNIYRFDNLITFRIDTYHYLSVIDRVSYLELQVRVKDHQPSAVCYVVQNAVTDALIITCHKFGWQYDDLRYGFLCHKCQGPVHLTLLTEIEPFPISLPENADCGNQGTKLTEGHKVWFAVSQVYTVWL